MAQELTGKKIAMLVADGFEQVELTQPKAALEEAGATVHIVSPNENTVRGWNHYDKADSFAVDVALSQADAGEYDALVLPGGTVNPDQLRVNDAAVSFVKAFFEAGKLVAAICHGPWTLVETGLLNGCQITSWPSLQSDLQNAGASWRDREVVVDSTRSLVTSRNPDDIPAFNREIVQALSKVPASV